MPRAAQSSPAKPAAEICLYGTQRVDHGSIILLPSGNMVGDGTPKPGLSMTEAIWAGITVIRTAGLERGTVRIFAPGGELCADMEISEHIPNAGALTWKRAPMYVVAVGSVDELIEASKAAGSAQ